MQKISVLALIFSAVFSGCSHMLIINAFEGADRPSREVAVLFTPEHPPGTEKKPRAFFSGIDGKDYGTYMNGYPTVTKVLPGKAMIKILCSPVPFSPHRLVEAKIEAGHFYELSCDTMKAFCVDRGTDYTLVRDRLPASARGKLP